MCRESVSALGLRTLALPLTLPPVPINLARHQRYTTDPASARLRDHVRTALQAVHQSP